MLDCWVLYFCAEPDICWIFDLWWILDLRQNLHWYCRMTAYAWNSNLTYKAAANTLYPCILCMYIVHSINYLSILYAIKLMEWPQSTVQPLRQSSPRQTFKIISCTMLISFLHVLIVPLAHYYPKKISSNTLFLTWPHKFLPFYLQMNHKNQAQFHWTVKQVLS